MTYQLRRYTIKPGEMDAWIAEWRRAVVPLRTRSGFRVEGAWIDRASDLFVWILSYEGDDGFESANERYYSSDERRAVTPDPARHLASTETTFMERVALG
jgi:hypothetical protein